MPPYKQDQYVGSVRIPNQGGSAPGYLPGSAGVPAYQQPGGWNQGNVPMRRPPAINPLEQPLPYMTEMDQGVLGLNNLINQTQSSAPPGADMNTIRMGARQGVYAQGLEGPLAASVENRAVGDFTNAWTRDRDARLMQLMGQRSDLVSRLQQMEYLRRMDTYQRMLAEKQAKEARQRGLFNTIGTIAGAGIGGLIGGPAGIGIGGQFGTGLGDLTYNIFGSG